MSNRTIIELNHDYSHVIDANRDEFVALVLEALRTGYPQSWEPLERFGVSRYVMAHHSSDRKAIVNGVEYEPAR